MPDHAYITPTALTAAVQVNGQMRCDCGCLQFLVGIAYSPETENNFIRVMECTICSKQHLIVHKSTAQLEPAVVGKLRQALT